MRLSFYPNVIFVILDISLVKLTPTGESTSPSVGGLLNKLAL